MNERDVQSCAIGSDAAWFRAPMDLQALTRLLGDAGCRQRVLKQDGRNQVTLYAVEGRPWVVKQEIRETWRMALYHRLHCSQAWRQWRGARRLDQAGIRINRPAALVHRGRGVQWLVLPFVPWMTLRDWALKTKSDDPRRRCVAQSVGDQAGRITAAGWINRDHKATNLMIHPGCEKQREQPEMIDLAGIRRRSSHRKVRRMFDVLLRTCRADGLFSGAECGLMLEAAIHADASLAPILRANALDFGSSP
ncbi:MAG: hypothetical protein IT440_02605 [Phycisphaeraceae bacterium]|nr:hypothetical protein [Phycisphaeraceae bacterium]